MFIVTLLIINRSIFFSLILGVLAIAYFINNLVTTIKNIKKKNGSSFINIILLCLWVILTFSFVTVEIIGFVILIKNV